MSSSSLVWEKKGSSNFKFKQQPDNNSPLSILLLSLKMITKCSKLCNETACILKLIIQNLSELKNNYENYARTMHDAQAKV